MSYTTIKDRETSSGIYRKKFKGLSMNIGALVPVIIWKPKQGQFFLTKAYYIRRSILPSNANTAIQFEIGVKDIAALTIGEGVNVGHIIHPVSIAYHFPFSNKNPLIIRITSAQTAGITATTWLYDLVLIATKISD
jgi:hypothetical protein